MFTDPWQFPQGRSTWPDVQSAEHGYMKLAGPKKKLMRIRQTIYEDPGNPFEDGSDDDDRPPESFFTHTKPLPPLPSSGRDEEEQQKRHGPVCGGEDEVRSDSLPVPRTPKNSIAFGAEFGDSSLPTAADRKATFRRSKSFAVPSRSAKIEDVDEYVPPRTLWRRDSAPLRHQRTKSGGDVRDTKFYGFYDELVDTYK
jgi:hypothetical protein